MKDMITISRKWNNPKIFITANFEGINLAMSMEDFVAAIKMEMPSIALTLTQKSFEDKLDAAVNRVIEGVKLESAKAM